MTFDSPSLFSGSTLRMQRERSWRALREASGERLARVESQRAPAALWGAASRFTGNMACEAGG